MTEALNPLIMSSKESKSSNSEEYEKFGLYPFAALQEIVSRLASGNFSNAAGKALVETDEFRDLERMAYEPPVPDPETQTVAGLIHYLENSGYSNAHGENLKSNPLLQVLKLTNIRKGFIHKPEEISRLLGFLEDSGFRTATQSDEVELRNDPKFHTLRRILTSAG